MLQADFVHWYLNKDVFSENDVSDEIYDALSDVSEKEGI
jgi:hypothetical protein